MILLSILSIPIYASILHLFQELGQLLCIYYLTVLEKLTLIERTNTSNEDQRATLNKLKKCPMAQAHTCM